MTVFKNNTLPALQFYKAILRKNLPPEEASARIEKLKLKRKQLKYTEDIELYHTTVNVIKDINENFTWHTKSIDLKQHLQDILNNFIIKNNCIIHLQQTAARALFEIIQLIRFPSTNNSIAKKTDHCLELINTYGTLEQRNKLRSILKKHNITRTI